MDPPELEAYGRICGWTLARAHARSGDRIAIAAYLGKGESFDRALATFAEAYADQNESDFRALQEAVAAGRVAADMAAGGAHASSANRRTSRVRCGPCCAAPSTICRSGSSSSSSSPRSSAW